MQSKPAALFPVKGLKCKACLSDYNRNYRAKNTDRLRELSKDYYEANKDAVIERSRKYYAKNKAEILKAQKASYDPEQAKAYRARVDDQIKDYRKAYWLSLTEEQKQQKRQRARDLKVTEEQSKKRRENRKRWIEKNRDARRLSISSYRASKAGSVAVWDKELTEFTFKEAYRLCSLRESMTGLKWHIDHFIPLRSRVACGLHVWSNFAVVPAEYNIRKSNKLMTENQKMGWL
ncbi:hypothetical protein [Polynucleobacter sp. UK-Kesae-W10]|uniref:hypothetical protein n=1 Tax=Polynucleobacter sp. UK-Kesae-W10 TaxID=1819738 RepID=UPI001C0C4F17|nr:hypothetical protein [Polynucleobacter sp. UK-Kesae-W10]MBU3577491.1 hypothetical protein [Polynucleobacter sp. UK-Kesae-W10]